jgi:hypothetical protein
MDYRAIGQAARDYLSTLTDNQIISTRELVSKLDPAFGPSYEVGRVLCRLADTELSDCAEHGEPTIATSGFMKGRTVKPWQWHKSSGRDLSQLKGMSTQEAYDKGFQDGIEYVRNPDQYLNAQLSDILNRMKATRNALLRTVDDENK